MRYYTWKEKKQRDKRQYLIYCNPVMTEEWVRYKYEKRGFKKLIRYTNMKDLVEYFTENYKEFDVLIQDTKELQKMTGLGVSNISKDDWFCFRGKEVHPMKVLVGLLKAKGNLTKAAVDMGIRRDKLQEYINNNEKVKVGADLITEMVKDYVEAKLMEKIDAGDRSAIQFWLNIKGIDRGYGTYEQRRRLGDTITGTNDKLKGDGGFKIE